VGKEKQANDPVDQDEVGDVEQLLGVRQVELEDGQTVVEYLVSWKDDFPDLWLPAGNVAEDLLSQYESAWWDAAKSVRVLRNPKTKSIPRGTRWARTCKSLRS